MKIDRTQRLTTLESYDAMRFFLEKYWERGHKSSNDIASLLGSLNRDGSGSFIIYEEDEEMAMPLDQAMWHDWLDAIKFVSRRRAVREKDL